MTEQSLKTTQQFLSTAAQAEAAGVPVNWKAVAFEVVHASEQAVSQLRDRVAELEAEIPED